MLTACADATDYTPVPKRVSASDDGRTVIYPERCPDWRHSSVTNYGNNAMSNWGCATAMNLGHQVANKRDLLEGRGSRGSDTMTAVDAIQRHYSGTPARKAATETTDKTTE